MSLLSYYTNFLPGSIFASVLLFLVIYPLKTHANEKENFGDLGSFGHSENGFHPGHRIDVSGIIFDSDSADTLAWVFAYTYDLAESINVSVTIDYLDIDFGSTGSRGFGDSLLSISWTPFTRISANPWVPRNVGTGMDLLIPTGDANEGRSLDTYVIGPYLGFVYPVSAHFTIAPNLSYYHSLDEDPFGLDIRTLSANVDLTYVCCSNFWISYTPELFRDTVTNDTGYNHSFVMGKMFSDHFGVSGGYDFLERARPSGFLSGQFDDQLRISLHVTF